ncbi:hypothetical protein [Vibrio sp. CAU 1672]|uniref:hypothetical protein n=1 Tax=Vibrio sp. CAU 1672 TaxID=3032594 RepID=UPI0023DC8257|nr:hypothetical protein [Vibrio sp. CAU 1672]MDF2152757.1 hypothetical protein [Vibrio sp. CAU 1672]
MITYLSEKNSIQTTFFCQPIINHTVRGVKQSALSSFCSVNARIGRWQKLPPFKPKAVAPIKLAVVALVALVALVELQVETMSLLI